MSNTNPKKPRTSSELYGDGTAAAQVFAKQKHSVMNRQSNKHTAHEHGSFDNNPFSLSGNYEIEKTKKNPSAQNKSTEDASSPKKSFVQAIQKSAKNLFGSAAPLVQRLLKKNTNTDGWLPYDSVDMKDVKENLEKHLQSESLHNTLLKSKPEQTPPNLRKHRNQELYQPEQKETPLTAALHDVMYGYELVEPDEQIHAVESDAKFDPQFHAARRELFPALRNAEIKELGEKGKRTRSRQAIAQENRQHYAPLFSKLSAIKDLVKNKKSEPTEEMQIDAIRMRGGPESDL
ncbi:MAG: hypothetical protein V4490_07295 [Pseudomonadota bacterium]